MVSAKEIREKLFTDPDDPFGLHKTLGFGCLVSFAFRLSQVSEYDMGFDDGKLTLATIICHLLLSVSSLAFHIPSKRITGAWRIWPEYRLHSIIFACRSLAFMALQWFGFDDYATRILVVVCTCAAADLASKSVGNANQSNTIRGLNAPASAKYVFSVAQFYATCGCLSAGRGFSKHYIMLWIVQVNAFLMTLARKNLASHGTLVTLYGLMIATGMGMGTWQMLQDQKFCVVISFGNIAALLRMGPFQVDKYVLWLGIGYLMHHLCEATTPGSEWVAVCGASFIAVVALGCCKIIGDVTAKKT